ncbi:MAG: DoxX family protein [Acidobacteria bacterium]|nr:MAG: DoxX family protein [Acidobacteriota bacterium]
MASTIRSVEPGFRSLLRIIVGLTFSEHGFQKLFGLFGGSERVHLFSLFGLAGILESVGGVLLIFGLFTVPVAFVLSGEMVVAYFKAHFPRGFMPIQNGGELAVVYCFVFLYLFVAGGGPVSLDRLVRKKK